MAFTDRTVAIKRAMASNRMSESVNMTSYLDPSNDIMCRDGNAGLRKSANVEETDLPPARRLSSGTSDSNSTQPNRRSFSSHHAPRQSHGSATGRFSARTTGTTGSVFEPKMSHMFSQDRRGNRSAHRAAVFHGGEILMREKSSMRKGTRWRHCVKYSRTVVDHKLVVLMSVFLTIYALTGDDFRLLLTDKAADPWFNFFTIVCITFFFAEIVLSCFGKHDYYMGFFFLLDVVSTVTLVLDLTWVSDYLAGDDFELGDRARSGRTARIGASVGRMVRVLRLIRIFKLYKAYYTAKQRKKQQQDMQDALQDNNKIVPGGRGESWEEFGPDDGWDDEDSDVGEDDGELRESLVGKKLSALTTRRTIILVLTMLLVLPLLRPVDPLVPSSAAYGADNVWQAFKSMQLESANRTVYESQLLKFLYYHSWFTGQQKCVKKRGCSNNYWAYAFWFGFAGEKSGQVRAFSSQAYIRPEAVERMENHVSQQDFLYNYGPMPSQVQKLMAGPWNVECDVGDHLHLGVSMLAVPVGDVLEEGSTIRCPNDLRPTERGKFNPLMLTVREYEDCHLTFYFDLRPFSKLDSLYSLGVTCFVCVVLCVASVFFANDANRLVLRPVEQMITKIEAIRENPLIAMKMADDEFKLEEVRRFKMQNKENKRLQKQANIQRSTTRRIAHLITHAKDQLFQTKETLEMNETVILEKTIIKLGWLLSLVFGEAGANIVSQNMSGSSAGVNAMVAGSRVDAIIGHARIRNFSTATEVLQGKVMTFVNQVAEIVHGIIDEFHGAANQNNGNTFLLIWRIEGNESQRVSKLADMSILAFAKIIGHVHRSPVLAGYRTHPGLQQRLGSDHKVSLTFGLHAGWAIEGAVGSEFKIDASYLSPNVSVAASLERATKQYGVSFLASQAVLQISNKPTSSKCRLIDKVRITGLKQPIELFTLDLDFDKLDVDRPPTRHIPWNVRQRFRARQLLEAEKSRKWSIDLHMGDLFEDVDMKTMRRTYTVEFLMLFNMGYQNYSQGEWQVARRVLSQTHTMLGRRDGPSGALLAFMENTFQYTAPEGWHGVRDLQGQQSDFASDL